MQKALVTGASGFLGKYIVQELSKQYVVHTLGRQADADYHADISTEIPQVNSSYDLIVHAAAKAHKISATSEEAADFFEVNEKGSRRLCEAFDQSKFYPKHWVFMSTVAVYGLEGGELIKETEPLNGLTPYARSKINAETILTGWCSEHGVKLTIFRLPLIAGPNPPGNLGVMIDGIRRNRYFNIDEGRAHKSIVMAEDVASCIAAVAPIGGTYNLTDGYHPSFAELAALIANQLDKNPPPNISRWLALPLAFAGNYLGNKAPLNTDKLRKITASLTFDDKKARTVFGWNPMRVLDHFIIN